MQRHAIVPHRREPHVPVVLEPFRRELERSGVLLYGLEYQWLVVTHVAAAISCKVNTDAAAEQKRTKVKQVESAGKDIRGTISATVLKYPFPKDV